LVTKEKINNFLSLNSFVLAGASRTGKKFGNTLYKELKSRNFTTYLLHYGGDDIEGEKSYKDFNSIPGNPEGLIICVNKTKTLDIIRNAYSYGIENIWIQQMSETKEAIEYCEENNINYIIKQCLLMYLDPVKGFHSFHKFINKILGKLPK